MGKHSADLKNLFSVSVVIPACSMDRWDSLCKAVASVRAQTVPVLETVVVIDHHPGLMAKAANELTGVTVIANAGIRGVSGARNTGAAASRGKVLAFLDDDAIASPNWLESLLQHFTDSEVVGAGGRPKPLWLTHRPQWFPQEFDWAVGCSYKGMPESATIVRNVWSNNMAIRRQAFDAVGGFRAGFGKIGAWSRPEDTDLCLRTATRDAGGTWIYDPNATVGHQVPAERTTLSYFLKRCYYEGQGKATLASLNGISESISTERQYARYVLPRGIVRGLREAGRGDVSGVARSLAIIVGTSFAIAGFLADRAVGYAVARHRAGRRFGDDAAPMNRR